MDLDRLCQSGKSISLPNMYMYDLWQFFHGLLKYNLYTIKVTF